MKTRNMLLVLLSTMTPAMAAAQTTRISNVHYDVTFDSATAASRTLNVKMTFDVAGPGPVLLSLPVWTPGAYEVTYFAKKILSFDVTASGKPARWDKTSYSKYRLYPGGAHQMQLEYTFLADTLDNAMAWAKPDFLLVNGTNIFFYLEVGSLNLPATVTFHTQPGWKIVTPMKSNGANTYSEQNYHDLVDMPVFIGRVDFDSAQADGSWNRLVSYPAGKMDDAGRRTELEQIGKLLHQEAAVFHELPWKSYTTMLIWDSAYGGASALEHQRSHVGVYNFGFLNTPVLTSITAHEMFHAWNVKRMRPSEMWPYRYGAEQPTPWLWVSEGITDYYADLAMSRAGLGGDDWFYTTTAGKISQVEQTPPVALEDASLSTWIHPVDGTAYIYYPKGSLAGFMIDIMIRDASNNKKSLDTVMREVYTTAYKNGRGFTSADWWGAVSRAAGGKSFADFNAKYVDGRESYPWNSLLPLAGMKLRTDTVYDPRLGVNMGGVAVVQSVVPGGAAAEAGVQPNDTITAVGDVKITDANQSFQTFRDTYRSKTAGSDLPIVVKRGGQELTLHAKLRLVPRAEIHLQDDPNASAKAVRIRNGILKGVTD